MYLHKNTNLLVVHLAKNNFNENEYSNGDESYVFISEL